MANNVTIAGPTAPDQPLRSPDNEKVNAMYAIVRVNSFDSEKLAASDGSLEQFQKAHGAQPGYVGTVVVDLQAGRRLVVNLWESQKHSTAALSVLASDVGRLLDPLMSNPSELVGVGTVIYTDLIPVLDS